MSKVKKITVQNLKAISDLEVDFNGCTAIITGGNNKGKSSFLKSLPERLQRIKPDVILKKGSSEGFAEWELTTGEKFIWQFDNTTKKGEKLLFITKDNIKTALTSEIASRYFPEGFDVDKFLNDGPKKQREALQAICGLDFTDIDIRYKQAYDNRTFANKQLEVSKNKMLPVNAELETEPTDYLELQKVLAGIDSHNEKYDTVLAKIDSRKADQDAAKAEISRLESLIYEEEQKIISTVQDIIKGDAWIAIPENKPKSQEEADNLQNQINDIVLKNKAIEENNKAILLKQEFEKSQEEAENAESLVKEIEQEKIDLIKSADLPIGFGFSDDGITYLGHAFNKQQLSSSAIYIAALKLASLKIGEVKTLHFDASYLDKNSLSEIETWAQSNDLQLLIERPDFDGGEIHYELINDAI